MEYDMGLQEGPFAYQILFIKLVSIMYKSRIKNSV